MSNLYVNISLTAFSKLRMTVRTDQNRSHRSNEAVAEVWSNSDYQNLRWHRTNMKRSASLVAAPSDRSSFQQPVSCRFCRTRKLKCDRGHPCFNCASRKHECEYESGMSIGQAARAGETDPPQQARNSRRNHLNTRLGVNLEAAMFVHSK